MSLWDMARAPNLGHFLLHPPSPMCFLYTFCFLMIHCLFHSQPFFSLVRRTVGDRHLSNASLIQASSSLLFLSFIVFLYHVFVSTPFPSFSAMTWPSLLPSFILPLSSYILLSSNFLAASLLLPSPLSRLLALSPAPALHIPCPFVLFPRLRPGTFRCR